jgi:hypothetical protein
MQALAERRIEMSIEGEESRIDDCKWKSRSSKPRSTPSPWRSTNRAHGAGLVSEVLDEAGWQ